MSPDLEKYRRLAQEQGDGRAYSDDDLLRLWAAMEHLFARGVTMTCPQLLSQDGAERGAQDASDALSLTEPPQRKEPRP